MLTILLASAVLASGADAKETAQRARWEQGRADQRAFEHRLFAEAGFQPIAEVEAEERSVRRLLPTDPYGMLPVPGVELERRRDGSVTLRLQYRGWTTDPVPVAASLWSELARTERDVFAGPTFEAVPDSATPPPAPPPVCHGWIVRFAAGYARTASWAGCGGEDAARYAYAVRVAAAAVATRPGCAFARDNPFWSFSNCFSAKPTFDDPALEVAAAPLRAAYDAAPGADRLAAARRALAAPGLTVGTPTWQTAREAVGRLLAVQDERRALLQQLQQLGHGRDLSAADDARLRQTTESWSESTRSQDANAMDLLRRLAWPTADAPRN